jgi:hypothetical protein
MVDRETTYIILTYILTALFITWPLVLHLDGFLLPKTVKDIHNHTIDTKRFIQLMTKSVRLFSEGKDFIIVLKDYAFPPLYALSAIPAILVFGLDRVVFHNIYLLTNIILAGVTMYLLMLELSGDKTASFFSGFLYMSSNCQLHHYVFGHTHYILIHWIPLIFLLIEKCLHKKNVRYAVMLGLILALQVLSSLQYSVYLSFIIPAYIALKISLVDRRILGDKHFWRSMVVAVFIALTLSSFYTVKRLSMEGPVRTIQDNLNPYWRLNSLKLLFDVNLNVHLGVIQFALMLWGVCIIPIHLPCCMHDGAFLETSPILLAIQVLALHQEFQGCEEVIPLCIDVFKHIVFPVPSPYEEQGGVKEI